MPKDGPSAGVAIFIALAVCRACRAQRYRDDRRNQLARSSAPWRRLLAAEYRFLLSENTRFG
ncbi:MAG: hypothetical protein Q8R51_12930 [Azonexus sp.]|nr:hypothetical protein [Azonexus sp.]